MRLAKVLKSFPYAHDGITIRTMEAGDVFRCQDDAFDGLVRDKIIKAEKEPVEKPPAPAPAKPPAAIEIPDNWAELNDDEKLDLATQISGSAVSDVDEAVKVIDAESVRRAAN